MGRGMGRALEERCDALGRMLITSKLDPNRRYGSCMKAPHEQKAFYPYADAYWQDTDTVEQVLTYLKSEPRRRPDKIYYPIEQTMAM